MLESALARGDQAAGLRRLLGQEGLAAITVLSGAPGDGKTTVAINLAAALGRAGRDALLLDSSPDGRGACARLGFDAPVTLAGRERGEGALALDELLLNHAVGVQLLPVGASLERFATLSDAGRARLDAALAEWSSVADVVLLDTESGADATRLPLSLAAADLLLVVTPEPDSIKGAYALVKRLRQRFDKRTFHLLLNRARDGAQATAVAANLAATAARFLDVRIEHLGTLPDDARIGEAARLRRAVVEAFPEAPSAPEFRRLAEALGGWRGRAGVSRAGALLRRAVESAPGARGGS